MPTKNSFPITERHSRSLSPSRLAPPNAPDWIYEIDNPYLHGVYAPTTLESEYSHDQLEVVEGSIPTDLNGAYYRNGTNPKYKPKARYHWFDGDGMVSAIWFNNGQVRYKNRYIQTRGLGLEEERQSSQWPGVMGPFDFDAPMFPIKDTANTDLALFDGKLLATWYDCGQVYALDPDTLETQGIEDFGGQFSDTISAHSKVDPATGEFVFFSYADEPPYMQYGVANPDGTLHRQVIDLPGARRPHDIGMTQNYSILHDFPLFHDDDFFRKSGYRVPMFHREVPTRYGVIPRHGLASEIRWFEFKPCYALHMVNCWEDGDWIHMVGCRTEDPRIHPNKADGDLAGLIAYLTLDAHLYVWRANLQTGETEEYDLHDLNAEFPTINRAYWGVPNRYAYLQEIPKRSPLQFRGIAKFDLQTLEYDYWAYGDGVFGSESPFAPRDNAQAEDDGYLVSFTTNVNDWRSYCEIFDAQKIAAGPICKIRIPERMPAGFHTLWVPQVSSAR